MLKNALITTCLLIIGAVVAAVLILNIDNAKRAVMNYLSLHLSQPIVLMMGDSHLARYSDWASVWSLMPWQLRNISVDGYQARQVFTQYRDQVANDNHCVVVVMAGINRISGDSPEDAARALDKLVTLAKKRGKAPVVLEVMYTENEDDAAYIDSLNMLLRNIAKRENIKFASANHLLSSEKKLLSEYSRDGLHLNNEGYEVLVNALKQQIQPYVSMTMNDCRNY